MIRHLPFRSLLLIAILALVPAAPSPRAATGGETDSTAASPFIPHLVLPAGPLAATEDFQWNVRVRVVNPLDRSIYLDSLGLDVTDLYLASRHRGRTQSFNVTKGMTDILKGVAPNDSGFMTFSGAAFAEMGRVTMRLHYHLNDGPPRTTPDASVEMSPSLVSVRHSPLLLETKKGKVEYSFVPELWPDRRSPAILLIHGEDGQARDWLPLAWNLANHGYSCMLMSLPGYGFSAGPPDFAGPRSLEAVNLLLDRLKRSANVDSNRVSVWGFSEGATVAALVAAKRRDLAAVVLQSGLYDLSDVVQATESTALRQVIEAEAGPRTGWKSRSPLALKALPSAPTLVLHGQQDRVVPAAEAKAYAALFPAKARMTLRLIETEGHTLPIVTARDTVMAFLQNHLPPPPPPRAAE